MDWSFFFVNRKKNFFSMPLITKEKRKILNQYYKGQHDFALYIYIMQHFLLLQTLSSGQLDFSISFELHVVCNLGIFVMLFCLLPLPSCPVYHNKLLFILKIKFGVISSENFRCTQFQIQLFCNGTYRIILLPFKTGISVHMHTFISICNLQINSKKA